MSQKINLSTPISYYGGKQSMLQHILPLLPDHSVYVEPFFGGGAVFWAKKPSDVEIINDFNGMVVNFYRQLKSNFEELKQAIDATPYSRQAYQKAMVVYENPYLFDSVTKAWAFWIGTSQGFSNKIGSWRSSQISVKESKRNENKKQAFTKELSERLKYVQIEQKDAVDLIKDMDTPDTFFYLDPPYVGADQGHYGGYMQEHFNTLLELFHTFKESFC
jgi:DNA adenine methylase